MTLRYGALSSVLEIIRADRSFTPHWLSAFSNNHRALRCSSFRLSVLKVRISSQSISVRVVGSIGRIRQVATSKRVFCSSSIKSNFTPNASPSPVESEFLILRNWSHCLQSKAFQCNNRSIVITDNQYIMNSNSSIFNMGTYRT